MATAIQWTDETWNPVTGCSKVSPGCAHCYAEGVSERFWAKQYPPVKYITCSASVGCDHAAGDCSPVQEERFRQFTDVMCHEDRLDQPLRWRKPKRIFVNSMSDLFHEDVPDSFIDKVFAVMAITPQHTFQVLTKRAERMLAYLSDDNFGLRLGGELMRAARGNAGAEAAVIDIAHKRIVLSEPLPNVWLGVSVENQRFADERIPLLLQTPAAVRFISAEPLLGPVDLGLNSATCDCCPRFHSRWARVHRPVVADFPMCLLPENKDRSVQPGVHRAESNKHGALSVNGLGLRIDEFNSLPSLDWVIVGGESGHGARPFDLAWARSIVQQCQSAGVSCFVKQIGAIPMTFCGQCGRTIGRVMGGWVDACGPTHAALIAESQRIRDSKGGDIEEWPTDLRVREFPQEATHA